MKIPFLLICLFVTVSCVAQDIPSIDWDALQETKPWEASEVWEPVPPVVSAAAGEIPSDAVVLFSGDNLDQWQKPQFGFEGANMEQITAIIKHLDSEQTLKTEKWWLNLAPEPSKVNISLGICSCT